jgi:hypothetical protein
MKKNLLPSLLFTVLTAAILSGKDYHLYYLGGQSNMDGYGFVKELPEDLQKPSCGTWIYHGNMRGDLQPLDGKGMWSKLQPGHGKDFKSDGKTNQYGQRFGVELSFARKLQELRPEENIALVKYSKGGTSIAIEAARNFGCWDPDFVKGDSEHKHINQYDHFLATLRGALSVSDIDGDGEADRLIPSGILWMQGESDGTMYSASLEYEANLKRLMDLIRASLHQDDLPVVVGRISDSMKDGKKVWEFGETLRAAQAAFCEKDPAAALVTSTDNYGYSDPWHYDTAGYLDLGEKFAEAMNKLRK